MNLISMFKRQQVGILDKRMWLLTVLSYAAMCCLCLVSVVSLGGCQAGFGFNADSKLFYPNKLGDPRQGAYAPGHSVTESRSFSSHSGMSSFPGIGGGGDQ